jgi:predicted nucleotidyltransferase
MKSLHLLLQRLADAGLEFVVIGGFAGVLHGSSYVTDDLGICAVLSPENIEKLRVALADLHPAHRITHRKLSFLDHPAPGLPVANLYLQTDAGVLDVLGDVLGLGDFHALKKSAIEIPLFGRKCRVVSIEDLIKAKESVAWEKDLLVAKELRAIVAKCLRRDSQ